MTAAAQGPKRGLLDTSVFIAKESGRLLREDRFPEELAVSVITLAELHAGVLAAKDTRTRALRLATIESVTDITTLDVNAAAARIWSEMRVHLAETGHRVRVNDLWIAAIAAAHKIPVATQDDDFEPVRGVVGLEVIRV
jgi:predicted nucleic acid-binding protein